MAFLPFTHAGSIFNMIATLQEMSTDLFLLRFAVCDMLHHRHRVTLYLWNLLQWPSCPKWQQYDQNKAEQCGLSTMWVSPAEKCCFMHLVPWDLLSTFLIQNFWTFFRLKPLENVQTLILQKVGRDNGARVTSCTLSIFWHVTPYMRRNFNPSCGWKKRVALLCPAPLLCYTFPKCRHVSLTVAGVTWQGGTHAGFYCFFGTTVFSGRSLR